MASPAQRAGGGPPRAVVVTGLGTTNPLAGDVAGTWQALGAGRCAVRALPREVTQVGGHELPVRIGAPLAVEPSHVLAPRQVRRLDRASQCALVAAREAWQQAGAPQVNAERLAVVVSPGMGPVLSVIQAWDTLRERGPRRVAPTAVPALMPNAPAVAVGLDLGARAGIHAPVAACASGAEALAAAADLIALGRADVVVAGGTDAALHPMTVAAFAASRPFAPDRDGFVLGEGAGILVLEAAEHAARRGAPVLAVLAGAAVTNDAYDVARPEDSGRAQERALRLALGRAGVAPQAVGHVNAHATSTPVGDVVEARVLARVLSAAGVSATKSSTGHLLGGAGGLEAVLTVMALVTGRLPPTLLPGGVDPQVSATGLDVVGPAGRSAPGLRAAVSTSFGFGGHNVALVLTRG